MSKFQEGDKVKFIKHIDSNDEPIEKGDDGEVIKVMSNEKPWPIRVYWNKKGSKLHKSKQLKLTEQNNMSDFKPFYVEVEGPKHSQILQEIAFEEEYKWNSNSEKKIKTVDHSYLVFNSQGKYSITHSGGLAVESMENKLEDPTLEEFRQALRGEYFDDPIKVGEYEVEFKGNEIKVGCESYHRNMIEHVYEAYKIGQDATYTDSSLNFKLHHSDVGEIPFEKVEAIYNRITD